MLSPCTELGPESGIALRDAHAITTTIIDSEIRLATALESIRREGTIALSLHTDSTSPMRATLLGIAFAATMDYTSICSSGP